MGRGPMMPGSPMEDTTPGPRDPEGPVPPEPDRHGAPGVELRGHDSAEPAPEARGTAPSPEGAYALVESLHLRQWCQRVVAPLAVLATNGLPRGPDAFVDVRRLPRADSPAAWLGLASEAPARAWLGSGTWIVGAAAVAGAAWLRIASKGVLVRKTTVTSTGAYALVRHPYYLANLVGCAGVLAIASPLGAVTALVWLAVALPVFVVTVRGEERGLSAIHGATWTAYAAAVSRLVPATPARLFRGLGALASTPVSWRNLCAENEPPRLMRFLAAAAVVVAARLGRADGSAILAVAAVLWASSFAVQRLFREPRRRA